MCEEVPLKSKGFKPHTRCSAQGSNAGRKLCITSGCENQQGFWLSEAEGFCSPRQFLSKGLSMDLLRLTPSEFLCEGRSSKGNRDNGEGAEVSGIRERAGKTDGESWRVAPAFVPLIGLGRE